MGTTTMERPQMEPVKAEWNHSCTSQCSTPCGASSEYTGTGIGTEAPVTIG